MLVGLPGAGKTTLARRLERDRRAVRFTLDEWVLRLHGIAYDHPDYGDRAGRCQELIWDTAVQVLGAGVDVVLDWNQWSRERRAAWRGRAEAAGAAVLLHYLDVPVDVAITRCAERDSATAHAIDDCGVRHLADILERPAADEGITLVTTGVRHRTRVVSTMTGAGYWWQAWCEESGCAWRGPSRRGGYGAQATADADADTHAEETGPAPPT